MFLLFEERESLVKNKESAILKTSVKFQSVSQKLLYWFWLASFFNLYF